ncbi:4-hydroxy-3-methylbut-2-enyl diphosphate reductase [Collinsella ihumii]|uniref:4-hydroxy-3-methylbut-2-enyl diphosphate reductase n=1 Tax=Collinsella ihumii TaxID=1720204 RepID=UPI0025AA41CB|nr:4-hydroxy-3-methylbut-2-enyl diphosphate reductase [Collinsella ihumii]MDN0054412.1 4-hydroxy-3-methylbut-2-enyl diphosphate reductase [Collinsella ihumii]
MARIEIAAHAGVCYGVERALSMAADAATSAPAPVHTLGPLIHNPLVVKELEAQGVGLAETLDDAASGSIIIRAHGVVPAVIEQARARDLTVLDATCPYVKRVHAAAEKLVREGYQLIVVGESGHPEVEGIMGHADGAARVVSCANDLADLEISNRVGVVVQTTQTQATLASVVSALLTRASEVRVINTICSATQERQQAASELASRADVMIVVGGKNSGNTRRLAQICAERCERTHHVEDACEIDPAWLTGAGLIGITAGASTPSSHIERAVKAIMETTGAVDAR